MPRLQLFGLLGAIALTACASTGTPPYDQGPFDNAPISDNGTIIQAEPLNLPPLAPEIPAPRAPVTAPPEEPLIEAPLWYDNLAHWTEADHRPAKAAFTRSCQSWVKADPDKALNPNLPQYGTYRDWLPACARLAAFDKTNGTDSKYSARLFFETEFAPLSLKTLNAEEGLLTGYYEPEIHVRLTPDKTYYEPILAKPTNASIMNLPRSEINAKSARVIAYGRPIDVFFMQIQGSGRIRYKDGRSLRAAYAGNNGKPYKSIGRVLVDRGDMKLNKASKQAIENWMEKNGPKKTKALMNENPRYIFFAEQTIKEGEGPSGAMRVPLTEMGSMAVDPRYHPYGTLAWLETKLPQEGGDYRGEPAGVLVSAQDTGSAIRGALRGDLFFGAGDEAGARAGVMKHAVRWTLLVPKSIAAPLMALPNS